MEHAPLVHNIEHALRKSAEGKLRGELMLDLLRARYANDEAHQQFAIAVEWAVTANSSITMPMTIC